MFLAHVLNFTMLGQQCTIKYAKILQLPYAIYQETLLRQTGQVLELVPTADVPWQATK